MLLITAQLKNELKCECEEINLTASKIENKQSTFTHWGDGVFILYVSIQTCSCCSKRHLFFAEICMGVLI